MAKEISHTGVVTKVTGDTVSVEIVSRSACSSCHAAGLCTMAEAVKKTVDVKKSFASEYKVGDRVWVTMRLSMGLKATVLAYVGSLFFLLAVTLSLSFAGVGELWSGLAGCASVVLYYIVLYIFRGRIERDYSFSIVKDNNLNS